MSEEMLEKEDNVRSESRPDKVHSRISLSGKAALIICGIYWILAFSPLGFILGIGVWSASFLVIYIGVPLAFFVWIIIMGYRLFIRKKKPAIIRTGIKYGIIVFGVMGFVFWFWGMTIAPKGTPIPDGWCVLKLEDGAWVWHEYQ